MMAVKSPCSGRTPLPMARASESGRATMATVMPAADVTEEKRPAISFAKADDGFGQEGFGEFEYRTAQEIAGAEMGF